jgi:hypothetical protein
MSGCIPESVVYIRGLSGRLSIYDSQEGLAKKMREGVCDVSI